MVVWWRCGGGAVMVGRYLVHCEIGRGECDEQGDHQYEPCVRVDPVVKLWASDRAGQSGRGKAGQCDANT